MLMIATYFTVRSRLKIANNPNFDSTSNRRAAAIARMKTNLLKVNISLQFEGEYSCIPRSLYIAVDNFVLLGAGWME